MPEGIEARDLDRGARAALKTLTKENADRVAQHLVAASQLLESDPQLAHRHALAAARRAGRIAVVRETLAITAYETGDFALALRELRTYRRISGSNDQLPLMVDSERGIGRPDKALELGRSVERDELPAAVQVALAIAMSGARLDLGQSELALAELEIPQLDPDRAFSYSPALFLAYAEVLEDLGRHAEAADWRARAERADDALGATEHEVFEVFELEEIDDDDTADAAEGHADAVDADDATETDELDAAIDEVIDEVIEETVDDLPVDDEPAEDLGDPADAIEPEVAAILAETADLADADETEAVTDGDTDEDGADGPVPDEK